jgi:hypothetical protein
LKAAGHDGPMLMVNDERCSTLPWDLTPRHLKESASLSHSCAAPNGLRPER